MFLSNVNDTPTQQGKYIQVNDLSIYYEEYGSGEPLILLHGATGTGSVNWKAHLPILSPHFRVIVPDLRGHGRTNDSSREIRLPMLIDDVVAFINTLALQKPFLCGWSMGGDITLNVGIHHPNLVKAMVVGGVTHRISETNFENLKAMGFESAGKINPEQFEKGMPQMIEWLQTAHPENPDYWKTLLTRLSYEMMEPTPYSIDDLRKVSTPALIILGDRDKLIPLEEAVELYRLIPHAELAVIPNADHSVSRSNAELYANFVKEFLLRHIAS